MPNHSNISRHLAGASLITGLALTLAACGAGAEADLAHVRQSAWSAPGPLAIAAVRGEALNEHTPENAIDGDVATRWQPPRLESPLEIELAYPAFVESVEVTWYDAGGDRYWREVHASSDGVSFREVANGLSPRSGTDVVGVAASEALTQLRLIPVLGEDYTFPAVAELRVMGRPESDDIPEPGSTPPEAPAPTPEAPTVVAHPVAEVHVDDYSGSHPGPHAVDGQTDTRWQRNGAGGWIVLVLEGPETVEAIEVDWYEGESRSYAFTVSGSPDGARFAELLSTRSSGSDTGPEVYTLPNPTVLSEVRLEISGNDRSAFAAIEEIRVLGAGAPAAEEPAPPEETAPPEEPAPPEETAPPEEPAPTPEQPSPGTTLRTMHVSPSGSDANDGSSARPWRSLRHAVAQLQAGDALHVHGASWSESFELARSGTAAHPIRVIAVDGATLDFRGQSNPPGTAVRISGSHVEVRGFSIRGTTTGFDLGDGAYPLNDVCANPAAFHEGIALEDRDNFTCSGSRPATNHRVENVIIDGRRADGSRAVLDLPASSTSWENGVNIFDEAANVVIRNYEMTRMRHAVFSDGPEQVRAVENLTLENLYVHHTRNYGARIIAREGHIATPAGQGGSGPLFWRYRDSGTPDQVYLRENMARRQILRNLVIRNSVFFENGFTNDSTGEAYGNVLIQGVEGGLVERSVFSDGPYWGIDALICDDVIYRNNVFSMRPAIRNLNRSWPDASDPWPVVGLEVNGGLRNKVYNNTFYGLESGLFESWFPEDFVATTISVESRNNLFWNNDSSVARFPSSDWLESGEARPHWAMRYVPVAGYNMDRRESDNLMDTGTNWENENGRRFQYLAGDPEFFGTGNVVNPNANVGFVDVANGNFRLEAGSAAVDAGATLTDVTDDHDGRTRSAGSYDLGAFER